MIINTMKKWLDNLHEKIQDNNDAEAWQILNEHALKWFTFGFCCAVVLCSLAFPFLKNIK